MTDEFSTYDAAYLLGSLPPADRAAYEAHLSTCPECRTAVSQLAGMPGLLASVSPEQARTAGEGLPDVPDTLLPRLLAEVQRTRFRRRVTTGLVGLAAAAVLAVALVAGLRGGGSPSEGEQPTNQAGQHMTAVSAAVPISATARLTAKDWGTLIIVTCTYRDSRDPYEPDAPLTYTMVVTDRSGDTQQIAAWEAKPGAPLVVDGSTSVQRSQIASVQVLDPQREPVLTLRL